MVKISVDAGIPTELGRDEPVIPLERYAMEKTSLHAADHGASSSVVSGAAQGIVYALPISVAMWGAVLLGVYFLS
jgi:hypothetical protein